MNWKYCVIRKMKPNSAKNVTVTAPLAALKRAVPEQRHVEHRVGAPPLDDDEGDEQQRR